MKRSASDGARRSEGGRGSGGARSDGARGDGARRSDRMGTSEGVVVAGGMRKRDPEAAQRRDDGPDVRALGL